jgi:hypothetical protein
MVKPARQIAINFPLCIILIAALSIIISQQPPRSIAGFLLSFLFPLLALAFGYFFVAAASRSGLLPSHPVLHFVVPILFGIVLLVCCFWLGIRLGELLHYAI